MMNSHDISEYNHHYYIAQLRDSRISSVILSLSFMLFLYADIQIFHYPIIIFSYRIFLILYFTIIGALSIFKPNNNKLLRRAYTIGIILIFGFILLLKIIIEVYMPQHTDRAVQVYIIIVICALLFGGLARHCLNTILLISLCVFMISEFILNGFHLISLYTYFNLIAYNIVGIIFNYGYIQVKWKEYINERILKSNIEQLQEEIYKRQKLEIRLNHMANYDELTNFYTRRVGLSKLSSLLMKADINSQPLSICYIDINKLKFINDVYGHRQGDTYIKAMVESIINCTRDDDLCIRLGGDEFLLVLPNTNRVEAEIVWKQICVEMLLKSFDFNQTIKLSASHGIAEYCEHNYPTLERFIDTADDLMYIEKRDIDPE